MAGHFILLLNWAPVHSRTLHGLFDGAWLLSLRGGNYPALHLCHNNPLRHAVTAVWLSDRFPSDLFEIAQDSPSESPEIGNTPCYCANQAPEWCFPLQKKESDLIGRNAFLDFQCFFVNVQINLGRRFLKAKTTTNSLVHHNNITTTTNNYAYNTLQQWYSIVC